MEKRHVRSEEKKEERNKNEGIKEKKIIRPLRSGSDLEVGENGNNNGTKLYFCSSFGIDRFLRFYRVFDEL